MRRNDGGAKEISERPGSLGMAGESVGWRGKVAGRWHKLTSGCCWHSRRRHARHSPNPRVTPTTRSFVAHMRLSYQETSDGEVRHVSAGDSVLVDDAHGKGHVSRHPVEGKTLILTTPPNGLDLPGLEPLGIGTSPCSVLSVDSRGRQHRPALQIALGRGAV